MKKDLDEKIEALAESDGEHPVLSLDAVQSLASAYSVSTREVEERALEKGVIPTRYVRNLGTVGREGQLKLLRSHVGVCGLGGLGGYVCELLARMGVGHLILADGDVFEDNNLNRQLLCREKDLGRPKAERAAERIKAVNSSVAVTAAWRVVGPREVDLVFREAQVMVDALDSVPARLALEEGCRRLGIPMVHGAIAGEAGQVMTVFPGDPGLKSLYGEGGEKGVEVMVGNPATTPALVASLQAHEVIKLICGGETIRNGFLLVDLSANSYQFIPLL